MDKLGLLGLGIDEELYIRRYMEYLLKSSGIRVQVLEVFRDELYISATLGKYATDRIRGKDKAIEAARRPFFTLQKSGRFKLTVILEL